MGIGDENRFFFEHDHGREWLPNGDSSDKRGKQIIDSPKMLLTVVWNMCSFGAFGVLPKGTSFDADHCCENIATNFRESIFFINEDGRPLCPIRESSMSAN
jgi:hypothetical protein